MELTGKTSARVKHPTKDRGELVVVKKKKLFCASKAAKSKTLLSNNNVPGPKTVEPTREPFGREVNARASRDADKQQTRPQLMVGKRRRSATRLQWCNHPS